MDAGRSWDFLFLVAGTIGTGACAPAYSDRYDFWPTSGRLLADTWPTFWPDFILITNAFDFWPTPVRLLADFLYLHCDFNGIILAFKVSLPQNRPSRIPSSPIRFSLEQRHQAVSA